jgi:hypothetical protein
MKPNQSHEAASRRDFLKAAAPAAMLAGLALPNVHAAGSDVIGVGVIGCGGRGEAAAQNAMNAGKDVRIVAMGDILLDRIQEKRTALKLKYPDQVAVPDDHCFTGFDAYKGVIEASDVVIIANAAKFHSLHARTAIEAGKHVFVEKPHAIDPVGIKTLRATCELAIAKGLSMVSGLQSRYHPGYIDVMNRVHDGAIGDIVAIQETWLARALCALPSPSGHEGSGISGQQPIPFPLALWRRRSADLNSQSRPLELGAAQRGAGPLLRHGRAFDSPRRDLRRRV